MKTIYLFLLFQFVILSVVAQENRVQKSDSILVRFNYKEVNDFAIKLKSDTKRFFPTLSEATDKLSLLKKNEPLMSENKRLEKKQKHIHNNMPCAKLYSGDHMTVVKADSTFHYSMLIKRY